MSEPEVITEAADVARMLDAMATQLKPRLTEQGDVKPAIIGIHSGGVWVAEGLHQRLGISTPLGQLNIAFYRDDFSSTGLHPSVQPSSLPFEVDNRHILLIDDILYTGRTVRAAMNEIFDYGRPARITLAVLVERSGRELPIQADVVGERRILQAGEHLKLLGPDPLTLTLSS